MEHAIRAQLEAGLEEVIRAPRDEGEVELIVRRPAVGEREVVDLADLDPSEGLAGDNWRSRAGAGTPNPLRQLTVMSSRAAGLVAGEKERWPLAGDQLYVDLDLSVENLPPGSLLAVGRARIEVTAAPHAGCKKFLQRYGPEALRFVNSPRGKALRLRGLNARVVRPGRVRVGDAVAVEARAAVPEARPA